MSHRHDAYKEVTSRVLTSRASSQMTSMVMDSAGWALRQPFLCISRGHWLSPKLPAVPADVSTWNSILELFGVGTRIHSLFKTVQGLV